MSSFVLLPIFLFVLILGFSFQEAFAVDMFLKIEGVEGESTDKSHGKEIDVLAISWQSSQQSSSTRGPAKASIDSIAFTKYIDKSTPKLFEALATGKHISEAKLVIRSAGQNPVEYLKYTLRDIIVSGQSIGGTKSENRPTESLSLNFGKIEVEYTTLDPQGKVGQTFVQGWDLTKNTTYCPDTKGICGDVPAAAFEPISRSAEITKQEEVPKTETKPTETKEKPRDIQKLIVPPDKPASIPISGEIIYKRGVPLEVVVEKPDGSTESFAVMPDSRGTYDTSYFVSKELPPGLYKVKVTYDKEEVESFSISIVKERVPGWIKNNAKWWASKQIADSDFINGIQYMIQQKIIRITGTPAESEQAATQVPDWVRNNAGWWADDRISEDEFVKALEFLIKNGIIRIS